MANINKNVATTVEIVRKTRNNAEMEILVIDGIETGVMGYVNPRDREAGIKAIQEIVNASNKRGMELVMEVMEVAMTAAKQLENGIEKNDFLEEIEVEGERFQISYRKKTIYTDNGITKVDSVNYDVPNDIVKEMLIDKAKLWLVNQQ